MNTLPKVIANIVYDYKSQIELVVHKEKFSNCINNINSIYYDASRCTYCDNDGGYSNFMRKYGERLSSRQIYNTNKFAHYELVERLFISELHVTRCADDLHLDETPNRVVL